MAEFLTLRIAAIACGIGGFLAIAPPLAAQPADAVQSALCTDAIRAAEDRHATPSGLLSAIARAESGRPIGGMRGLQPWPWAINADGQAFYGSSKAEALAWARAAQARGVRFMDVGCAQVNLQFHPSAFRDLENAFDPAANADYAARFLAGLAADAGGNWYAAAGHYHSRTPELAAAYRERVAAIAAGRDPPASTWQPLYVRAIRQGSLRLALTGGGTLVVNVNRQPSAPGRRRMSSCQVAAVLAPLLSAPARLRACRAPARQARAASGNPVPNSLRSPLITGNQGLAPAFTVPMSSAPEN